MFMQSTNTILFQIKMMVDVLVDSMFSQWQEPIMDLISH